MFIAYVCLFVCCISFVVQSSAFDREAFDVNQTNLEVEEPQRLVLAANTWCDQKLLTIINVKKPRLIVLFVAFIQDKSEII